jgi:putative PIN family toxin of toxin-antitoxin system
VKLILDTNVLISGIFFGGPPGKILQAWRDGRFTLILSPEIFDEYQRVAGALHRKFPLVDLTSLIELIVVEAEMVQPDELDDGVCADPDDDKFIACALAAGAKLVVSGDKHLLDVNGYRGIEVLKPRTFIDRHLLN